MDRRAFAVQAAAWMAGVGEAAAAALPSPLDAMRPTNKANAADGLVVHTADGEQLHLETIRGRFIILNVWASWCYACRDEMPALSRLASAMISENLSILPLAIERDGLDAVAGFYETYQITNLPLLLGDGNNVAKVFGEWGLPFTILIDGKGTEIARVTGSARWDDPAFIAWLKPRLAS